MRDHEGVKKKFDRFSNENKMTGQGYITTPVRRLKRIAKAILGRSQPVALDREEDSDGSSSNTMDFTNENDIVGERRITNSRTENTASRS